MQTNLTLNLIVQLLLEENQTTKNLLPRPSGITASTQKILTGGIRYWAIDLVKHGYFVETSPYEQVK